MTQEIYDWEATLHKMVTSKAGDLVGNVDAVDDTSILVSTEGDSFNFYRYIVRLFLHTSI
jgi:hypothetical protein